MSNIHRIGDIQPDPNQQRRMQQQQAQQQQQQQRTGPPPGNSPFMMGAGGGGAGGSMYPPINKVLAPNFTVRSFIFIISIIQILVFSLELVVGGVWFVVHLFKEMIWRDQAVNV